MLVRRLRVLRSLLVLMVAVAPIPFTLLLLLLHLALAWLRVWGSFVRLTVWPSVRRTRICPCARVCWALEFGILYRLRRLVFTASRRASTLCKEAE